MSRRYEALLTTRGVALRPTTRLDRVEATPRDSSASGDAAPLTVRLSCGTSLPADALVVGSACPCPRRACTLTRELGSPALRPLSLSPSLLSPRRSRAAFLTRSAHAAVGCSPVVEPFPGLDKDAHHGGISVDSRLRTSGHGVPHGSAYAIGGASAAVLCVRKKVESSVFCKLVPQNY